MPFGGGGGLHAGALVKEVGLKAALVPPYPGVTSALGCVIADMRHDFVQTVNRTLADIDFAAFNAEIDRMAEQGTRLLDRSGVAFIARDTLVACDMLYLGQTHTVSAPIAWQPGRLLDVAAIREAFERRYREVYGRLLDSIPIRVLNIHVALIGRRPKLDLAMLAPTGGSIEPAKQGVRPVYVGGELARGCDLCAARTAGRRDDRGTGDPRAGGRDDLRRTGPAGACRSLRQRHYRTAGPMIDFTHPEKIGLVLVDLQNDFLASERRLCARRRDRAGRSPSCLRA